MEELEMASRPDLVMEIVKIWHPISIEVCIRMMNKWNLIVNQMAGIKADLREYNEDVSPFFNMKKM